MAYAPRRRGGIAKEVSSFATAFMQGMKLFSDDDRRGRSRANDPYSDENLAKRDERLGTTSALGRLFGRGENELTGFDRGRAALEEKMRIAAERGDASAYQKYAAERVLLEKQAANPAVGEKWNTPPAPAKGEAPARPAVPARAPAPAREETPAPAPVAPPRVSTPVPDEAPTGTPTRPLLEMQSSTEETPRPQAAVGTDEITAPAPVEKEVTQPAVYEWNPDKGSIFDYGTGFSNAPDYELGVDVARGGMIPTMYAARGASVTSRTGDTGGMGTSNLGALYTAPGEFGYAEGELGEDEEPGTPTLYDPNAPAVGDDERGASTANLGLSRDPEELAMQASPAVAAGIERIQAELKPTGAISAEDPAYQEKLQKFARGEGRMSEEEIKQLDSVVDPDGKLSPAARSSARLAAIYKFYQDRGEPDTARDVAARVMLYDKFASQTRGAMALEALKSGDMESGVKLLEDAYNQNMPDGKTIRVARDNTGKVVFNDDGTINFNLGWDKLTGFQTTQEGRAGRQDLIQLASNTATGTEQMQRFMQAAEKKGAARAPAGASDDDVKKGLEAVRAAATELKEARGANDPEAAAVAGRRLQEALGAVEQLPVGKMRDGRPDERARSQRMTQANNAVTSIIGSTGSARTTGGSKEERAAAVEEARLAGLNRRESALRSELSPSLITDAEEESRIRKGLQEVALERANIAAERAPKRTPFSTDPKERAQMISEAVDAFLEEGKTDPKTGNVDTTTTPKLERDTRRRFVDIADRLLGMNDQQPDTVVRGLYNMTQNLGITPRLIGDAKGGAILAVGGDRFIVDRDTYRRIAEMRGETRSAARKEELTALQTQQAKQEQARASAVLPIDREQVETGRNISRQGLNITNRVTRPLPTQDLTRSGVEEYNRIVPALPLTVPFENLQRGADKFSKPYRR